MRHFGGWFRAMATMLASLAMIVSTAVTAYAAGDPPFVPASHGRLADPTQGGDWGPALAVILVVAGTSILVLGLKGARQHVSRQGQAAPVTDATA